MKNNLEELLGKMADGDERSLGEQAKDHIDQLQEEADKSGAAPDEGTVLEEQASIEEMRHSTVVEIPPVTPPPPNEMLPPHLEVPRDGKLWMFILTNGMNIATRVVSKGGKVEWIYPFEVVLGPPGLPTKAEPHPKRPIVFMPFCFFMDDQKCRQPKELHIVTRYEPDPTFEAYYDRRIMEMRAAKAGIKLPPEDLVSPAAAPIRN